MWGVQIPSNDFWFLNNDKYKYNFFIGGGFFGYYVYKSIMLTSCIDDAERSAQYERKHKNNFTHGRCCFYTKNQWDKGGLSDERTTEVFKEQAEKLCLDYPEFYKGIKETNKKHCPIRLIKKIQRRPKVQF